MYDMIYDMMQCNVFSLRLIYFDKVCCLSMKNYEWWATAFEVESIYFISTNFHIIKRKGTGHVVSNWHSSPCLFFSWIIMCAKHSYSNYTLRSDFVIYALFFMGVMIRRLPLSKNAQNTSKVHLPQRMISISHCRRWFCLCSRTLKWFHQ